MRTFRSSRPDAPAGFFAAEAAGLAWLAEPDVIPVVPVLEVAEDGLTLEHLSETSPSPEDAAEFGRRLARLHAAGADGFGWTPAPDAWFGPMDDPFPVPITVHEDFTTFWAQDRLRPLAERTAGLLGAEGTARLQEAIDAIAEGWFAGISGGEPEPPARVHGDLWAGNVMWTPAGTLIDPAAHGGHPLEDLALLGMFGAPHLEHIRAGYAAERSLPEDWAEDLPVHMLFALLAHVDLFGDAYTARTIAVAEAILERVAVLRSRG